MRDNSEIDLPLNPNDLVNSFYSLPSDIIKHFTLDGFTAIVSEAVAESMLDANAQAKADNDADSNNQLNASR